MNRARRVFLKRPARRPGAEEKFFCPGTRFAAIPLIIEVIPSASKSENRDGDIMITASFPHGRYLKTR